MIDAARVRQVLPQLVLAALPMLLGLWFGGYHPRHSGWVVLVLAAWACVLAFQGRLSAPRSLSGVATISLAALVGWTAASIGWADLSRHDAWVEAMRALGYAAAFVIGGALLSSARAYARYAWMAGAAISLVAIAAALRIAASDRPLRAFVAGRLDWPIGYAPGLAGMCLLGMLLLLGAGCAAQQRARRRDAAIDLVASALALGGAGACLSVALLAQSRGTVPAFALALVVALVATPNRTAWLVRFGATALAVALAAPRLGEPYRAMFDLRQAPFTEGADADALLAAAEAAAHDAGRTVLVELAALAVVGAAAVPTTRWLEDRVGDLEQRLGMSIAVPLVVLVAAIGGTLALATAGDDGSPVGWAREQWRGCVDPPDTTGDPGSARSYFANAGTGRCDYYRVAFGAVREHPVAGLGAGNFRGEYVRERRTAEEPRVVHSLPLQLLAELGIVGAALGATVLGCVVVASTRFVRSGAARDATFAGAVAALAYWAAHASIDWLWQLPAVSLPAMLLGGGLVACVSPPQGRVPRSVSGPIAAGVAIAALALVLPVTMADARLRTARDAELQERDPGAAIEAARSAQDADPTWAEPAITEGILWAAQGEDANAAAAARRAVELEPRNWSVQLRASGLLGLEDRAEGFAAYEQARELNPLLDETVDAEAIDARAATEPDTLQNPDA